MNFQSYGFKYILRTYIVMFLQRKEREFLYKNWELGDPVVAIRVEIVVEVNVSVLVSDNSAEQC